MEKMVSKKGILLNGDVRHVFSLSGKIVGRIELSM